MMSYLLGQRKERRFFDQEASACTVTIIRLLHSRPAHFGWLVVPERSSPGKNSESVAWLDRVEH